MRSWNRIVACGALALIFVLSDPAAAAGSTPAQPAVSQTFSLLDPDGEISRRIDPDIASHLVDRLRRETRRSPSGGQTLFDALRVAASELEALESRGVLDSDNRPVIGAFVVLAVVDLMVERHPRLALDLRTRSSSDGTSPIERMCSCDRSGSRACGCLVSSTGSGTCQYRVWCGSFLRAACSAVNLELCIAREVIDIVTPLD
jgi:hypothetical protein